MRPFTRFWRKLSVISLLLEIFRRLNAILIAFYTAIATYAVVSVETSLTVRKMRTYTRSCRKRSVISVLFHSCWRYWSDISTFTRYFHHILLSESYVCQLHRRMKQTCAKNASICSILRKLSAISLVFDILRCLNAISIAFYTLNATHAVFSVETIPPVRRMRPFTRFWRHTERYFAFLEIFRRLYAISMLFHTPSATYASFIVERSRPVRKMRSFPRCWRKLSTISLALKIFRRLKAISIAHYKPNATHSVFSVETIPTVRKMRPFTPFWRKLCVVSILLEIFRC